MNRIMVALLATLACIAGLFGATTSSANASAKAAKVIYPVITIQHCVNDDGPIWATGSFKTCVGVKWQRQADGVGIKVSQMYVKTTGNTSWLEPTAITDMQFNGYYCSYITDVQGCALPILKKASPVHSRLRGNMNTTLYPGTTMVMDTATGMITFEGDFHRNNAGDYRIAIVVEFGYGANVPWAGGACDGTCTGVYFTNQ